ncbi:MAG: DUF3192 domain-containing protein [Lentisphaerae bacterium]|nr:DUF3192 domain-containing protein [Lentisphaerota bacterium]
MKKTVKHFCQAGLAALLVLCLTGCYSQASKNLERSRQLRVGMTKAEVLKIMGDPVKEEFSTPDRWYYFVNPVWGDGLTTEEECMPLVFEKGKLSGWGNKYYASRRAAKKLKTEADDLLTSSKNEAGTKEIKKAKQLSPKTVTPAATAAPGNSAAVKKSEETKTEETKK